MNPARMDLSLIAAGAVIGLVLTATRMLQAASPAPAHPALTETDDLPLRILPAEHPVPAMAVLVTGDGGWRALDRDVAAALNARGVSVIGLSSPDYFAERRTPEEAAYALERIIVRYSIRWRAPTVIAIGYSRGAGVLPFMLNRLPGRWGRSVAEVVLIGLEPTIDFVVTPFDLFRTAAAPHEVPVLAEVEKLSGKKILCFYGESEHDSLCRALHEPLATTVREPGGHHFQGNYDDVAAMAVKALWPRRLRLAYAVPATRHGA